MNDEISGTEASLRERLELPRAILIQLRDTCLFSGLVDQAIEDIDYLLGERPGK